MSEALRQMDRDMRTSTVYGGPPVPTEDDADMYFPRIEIRKAIAALDHYCHTYEILPLRDNLIAYRDHGTYVGGFLTALLSGDYAEAMNRADHTNLWLLPIYASFLYNEMPGNSHGTPERVAAWLASFRAASTSECTKCEDGVCDGIEASSASKAESWCCTCPRGQERQADHNDALESFGADKADQQQRGECP